MFNNKNHHFRWRKNSLRENWEIWVTGKQPDFRFYADETSCRVAGGVASLNHRLQAGKPLASEVGRLAISVWVWC